METIRARVENQIRATYGANAEFILNDWDVNHEIAMAEKYGCGITNQDQRISNMCERRALEKAELFNEKRLTPATAKIGDGATIRLWSDRHACTIIKMTRCTITVQQDKATLDPNFKPEWIEGGFAGHCTNQDEQSYTYERDPNGRIKTFRWSKKNNCYQGGGDGSIKLSKGRHEFYDYNF